MVRLSEALEQEITEALITTYGFDSLIEEVSSVNERELYAEDPSWSGKYVYFPKKEEYSFVELSGTHEETGPLPLGRIADFNVSAGDITEQDEKDRIDFFFRRLQLKVRDAWSGGGPPDSMAIGPALMLAAFRVYAEMGLSFVNWYQQNKDEVDQIIEKVFRDYY